MGNSKRATAPRPPLTFAQVKQRISRPRRIVPLVLNGEVAAQLEHLETLLQGLVGVDDESAKSVAAELRAAERAAERSRVNFVLEAVSHTTYKELQEAHPATKERLDEVEQVTGERWAVDPDVFAPILVQAQLIEPRPTSDEEFAEFWESLSDGQLRQLWMAALAVQMQVTSLTRSTLAVGL